MTRQAKERGSRVIVDSSGPGLAGALAEGVFLFKPSRRELEALLGRDARSPADEEALAREVIDGGQAEVVALTLGAEGAVLATRDRTLRLASPPVEAVSAVGAGDSFVGAMVCALAEGRSVSKPSRTGSRPAPLPP